MKRHFVLILVAILVLAGLTATAQIQRGSDAKRTCVVCKQEKSVSAFSGDSKTCKGCVKKAQRTCVVCKQKKSVSAFSGDSKTCKACVKLAEKQSRQHEEAERQRLAEEQRRQQEKAKRQRAEAEELRRQQEELAQQRAAIEEQRRQQEDAERMRIIQQASDDMVYVEGGAFKMGMTKVKGTNDALNYIFGEECEKPLHKVKLAGFYISKYEVTQELWQAVMGNNPSEFKGDKRCPVVQVSWEDCQEFIRKLNQLTGRSFRLPTEAEWEYAARGGKESKGYQFAGSNNLSDLSCVFKESRHRPVAVGSKSPNELGLYDMSGNVFEWCQDFFGYDYYSRSPTTNPTGPSTGEYRVIRGGSWGSSEDQCRVSYRGRVNPSDRRNDLGLRLAL